MSPAFTSSPAQRYTRLAQLLAASPTPTPTQER
jgi:hypothetical protein